MSQCGYLTTVSAACLIAGKFNFQLDSAAAQRALESINFLVHNFVIMLTDLKKLINIMFQSDAGFLT